jgi:hypothetical protein
VQDRGSGPGGYGALGTNGMPHFGHRPGSFATTSGCIGQVYACPADAAGAAEVDEAWSVLLHPTANSSATVPSVISEYRIFRFMFVAYCKGWANVRKKPPWRFSAGFPPKCREPSIIFG